MELQSPWEGALRSPHVDWRAAPQLQRGQEELGAGPQVLPAPEPGPKSAIRTNPQLSLGSCRGHQRPSVARLLQAPPVYPISAPPELFICLIYMYTI